MVFTSWEFLIFFPLVTALYFALPVRHRWWQLLIASYYFYMAWKPAYATLLAFSTLSFYGAALAVDRLGQASLRRIVLVGAVGVNLAMLFTFKYYNFFESQFNELALLNVLPFRIPALDVVLPMGISFYTFQGISYLVDVYRRDMPAERHLGLLFLYKAFFPQLVAGPIERGTHFLPQLRRQLLETPQALRIRFDYDRVVSGLRLMLLGFFKKIVLADNFAAIVQPVYATPEEFSSPSAAVATIAFSFQIFFDFSAYTDIARGISRVLGFELMENFKRPYFAPTIGDFWKRWHISLSSWFRDYLYVPLGGNRVARWRWLLNLWIVFLLCGLWHGANWTFVVWGALHGFYYFLTYALAQPASWLLRTTRLTRYPVFCRLVQTSITFSMVCWAWVVFRAQTLAQALEIWSSILDLPLTLWDCLVQARHDQVPMAPLKALGLEWLFRSGDRPSLMPVYVTILTAGYLVASFRARAQDDGGAFARLPRIARWATYFLALTVIALLGQFSGVAFIYFQF